jgi:ATP-dependent protease ClpP protease subunit
LGVTIYKARTRLSLETIARFGEETLVFDAESAVSHGIIDRVGDFELGRPCHEAARRP